MRQCCVVECTDNSTELDVLRDPVTGQNYVLQLCEGHSDEFECYHFPQSFGGN